MNKRIIFQPYEDYNEPGVLADSLIYYDRVALWATQLPHIVQTMGLNAFEKALESGAFTFLKSNTHLVPPKDYLEYQYRTKEDHINEWLSIASGNLRGPIFLDKKPNISINQADSIAAELVRKCQKHLIFIDCNERNLGNTLQEATYNDYETLIIPRYLDNISHNLLFTLQRLLTVNLELSVLNELETSHIITTPDLTLLHCAKFHTSNMFNRQLNADIMGIRNIMWDLNAVENILNFEEIIDSHILSFDELVDIRNSTNGKRFRKWFHETIMKPEIELSSKNLIEVYLETFKKSQINDSNLFKVLKVATTISLGLLNPYVGIAASTIDFMFENILHGWRPSYFLHDELYVAIVNKCYNKPGESEGRYPYGKEGDDRGEEAKQRQIGFDQMVKIPAGKFLYGENKIEEIVEKSFLIDVFPVTNSQYKRFVEAGGYTDNQILEKYWSKEGKKWIQKNKISQPKYWEDKKWNHPEHPVVGVNFYEAEAYAKWTGKRLPTEQEWEKAARGTDGREYPWKDNFDKEKCNSYESGIKRTTRVDCYPNGMSPYECYDMIGNVSELTDSWHDEIRDAKVVRGGSWFDSYYFCRCANRCDVKPNHRVDAIGFRCAKNVLVLGSSPDLLKKI